MNLSRPHSAVAPSLDGDVLAVLAKTSESLTSSEIARAVKTGSARGVDKALARLVEQGLVDPGRVGRFHLYTLNRDHLAADAALALSRLNKTLLDRIAKEIQGWMKKPLHASVYGSLARGEGGLQSDIDVLIIRGEEDISAAWETQLNQLARKIERWTGNQASIHDLSMRELLEASRRHEPIIDEVVRDSINVFGEDVRRLLGRSA